jgi:hypothetical protein
MIKQYKKSRDDIRRVQELRRSNAATRYKSAKDYRRKPKHHKGWTND